MPARTNQTSSTAGTYEYLPKYYPNIYIDLSLDFHNAREDKPDKINSRYESKQFPKLYMKVDSFWNQGYQQKNKS